MDKVTRQCPQTTTFLKRKESRSGIEPRSFRLPAWRLTARPNRLTTYSLAPCDFFLFPKVKRQLKGKHFQSIKHVWDFFLEGVISGIYHNQCGLAPWSRGSKRSLSMCMLRCVYMGVGVGGVRGKTGLGEKAARPNLHIQKIIWSPSYIPPSSIVY